MSCFVVWYSLVYTFSLASMDAMQEVMQLLDDMLQAVDPRDRQVCAMLLDVIDKLQVNSCLGAFSLFDALGCKG